jgi:hypothetical protein
MFQLRTEPRYLKIQKLIREDLGRLVRVNWINTDWYRTEAYYASGGWRATWPGGKNPFAPFSGNGVQYTDDVSSWATVESADDYTIPTILIFARRAGP